MGDVARNAGTARTERSLAWAFVSLVGITLMLIVLGAMVRAHGAGLACPDWPLCFGQWVPRFDFRVAYEWSHRVLASLVSLGLLALTLLTRLATPALWMRLRTGLGVAWGLLTIQVVLGGLTVLLKLQPWTVTAHLVVGISFCAVLLWLSRDMLEQGRPPQRVPVARSVTLWGALAFALLLAQILLGGLVSSQFAGLACTSFPTCDGTSFAPSLSGLVGLHVLHRFNALALFLGVLCFSWSSRREPRVYRFAFLALRLVLVQIGVGVLNVLVELSVEVTALHTLCAAGIALLLSLALREISLAPGRTFALDPESAPKTAGTGTGARGPAPSASATRAVSTTGESTRDAEAPQTA